MHIVCATTLAAAEVVGLLLRANLLPAYHFRVASVCDPVEAIVFTPRNPFPDELLKQIAEVPETQIVCPPIVSP